MILLLCAVPSKRQAMFVRFAHRIKPQLHAEQAFGACMI